MKFPFLFACFFILLATSWASECTFLAFDDNREEFVTVQGKSCDERLSPCSTFKIALSLMGYEEGILLDENTPEWPYKDYDAFLESWKNPQTPQSWMNLSVVWYSQVLTPFIGMEKIQNYLSRFDYGNQDMRGDPGQNNGLTNAWLCSSLKISPREQILFLKKLIRSTLPISHYAMDLTKKLLFTETLEDGWQLYGKTGTGYEADENGVLDRQKVIAWYVGWIEKDAKIYIFALNLRNITSFPSKAARIEMVKGFFRELGVL